MTHPWQVTTRLPFGHCSYCGGAYPQDATWPRVCVECGETIWRNPLPVSLLLMPVSYDDGRPDGVIVVRRAIEPGFGELCLPGGFLDFGETWPEGAVREMREETGILADVSEVRLFDVQSTGRHVLVFGIVPARRAADLPDPAPTPEASEWLILREPRELVFPTHTTVLHRYFASA
jgi:8-oxo-dGTP diphosphatase